MKLHTMMPTYTGRAYGMSRAERSHDRPLNSALSPMAATIPSTQEMPTTRIV